MTRLKRYVVVCLFFILLMPIVTAQVSLTKSMTVHVDSGDPTTVAINPTDSYAAIGGTFTVNVNVTNVDKLTGWQFTVYFLKSILNCTNVTEGSFLKTAGSTYFGDIISNNYNGTYGRVVAYDTLLGTTGGVNGSGVLASITFKALSLGDSPLHLADTKLGDENIPPQPINHSTMDGTAHVQGFSLTVSTIGNGTVSLNASQPYYFGQHVKLSASPDTGWCLQFWTGNLSGSANPAVLTITGNMAVTAHFAVVSYTLTICYVGMGGVARNNTGPYYYGTHVELTAFPTSGWLFRYWSGNFTGFSNPATLVITGNTNVTVNFMPKPTLKMSPSSTTCGIYGQGFTVKIMLYNASNTQGFEFQVRYNATLLQCTGWTLNAWASGSVTINGGSGVISGYTSGSPKNGTLTLITLTFQAAYHHIWKTAPGWVNNLTAPIFLQMANLSCPIGSKLIYTRGNPNQINVGPDFIYTFSPIPGDVNNDGTVDIYDLRTVAVYFNVKDGDPSWPQASYYDLDGNLSIDVFDLRTVGANFGYTYIP